MKKTLIIIWSIFFLSIGFLLWEYTADSQSNKAVYETLQEEYQKAEELGEEEKTVLLEENTPIISEKYKGLMDINKDLVGWISIPNTPINYPVVRNDNNEFYLQHDFSKAPSKAGAIFMDFRNVDFPSAKNTILYGHYMRNGTMFGSLIQFKEEEFLKSNQIISFNSIYEDIEWEIFSAYITDVAFNYIKTNFQSEEDYGEFLESLRKKSMFQLDTAVSAEDQILTLSTCSYEFDNARFVIHAKKLKQPF